MVRILLAALALGVVAAPAYAAPPSLSQSVAVCDPNQNPSATSCLSVTNGGFATAPAAGSQGTTSANPTFTTASTPSYTVLPAASTSGTPQAAQAGGYGIALPSAGAFGSGNAITVTDTANNGAVRQYATYSASQVASICVSAGDTVSATSTVGNQTQAVNLNFNPSVVCGAPATVNIGTSSSANPVASFQQTATTSAVAMPSNVLANGLIFTAKSTNTGIIYVGPAGVTTATGYALAAGQSGSAGVANSNQLYMVGSVAGDVLQALGN